MDILLIASLPNRPAHRWCGASIVRIVLQPAKHRWPQRIRDRDKQARGAKSSSDVLFQPKTACWLLNPVCLLREQHCKRFFLLGSVVSVRFFLERSSICSLCVQILYSPKLLNVPSLAHQGFRSKKLRKLIHIAKWNSLIQ